MTSTYSTNKQLQLQGTGDNINTWGAILNTNVFDVVDTCLGSNLSLSVAGNSNVTLTYYTSGTYSAPYQNQYATYTFTGALTGNIQVIWPSGQGWTAWIYNNTSGAFTLTAITSGGTGISIPQGIKYPVWSDGTNVYAGQTFSNISGDGTVTSSGALTVTKTNGTALTGAATASYTSAGSWTPSDQSGASLTFSSVSASYTQIGNMVFAYAQLTYPNTADGSTVIIGGLPVATANQSYINGVTNIVISEKGGSGNTTYFSNLAQGSTTFRVFPTNGGPGAIPNSTLSQHILYFQLTYPVS